jgi:hypothetical protein
VYTGSSMVRLSWTRLCNLIDCLVVSCLAVRRDSNTDDVDKMVSNDPS